MIIIVLSFDSNIFSIYSFIFKVYLKIVASMFTVFIPGHSIIYLCTVFHVEIFLFLYLAKHNIYDAHYFIFVYCILQVILILNN
jgi:hypothetical protein